ncbi:MAG: DNA repair exonuclease [bacterium]|nr:DNA repair exonuclease [bacterium]
MSTIRFIHAADLHLDSPFTGLRALNPAIAGELQESTFLAFNRIIDLCIEHRVDFLLVAGDVYDGADRSVKAQIRFGEGLSRLGEAGISTYVIHGNHDPLDGWRAQLGKHPRVHIFGEKMERVSHHRDGVPIAAIYGMSYGHRDVRENLSRQYQRQLDDPYAIGLLHANVGGDTGHESYAPCSVQDLLAANLDYWALGHIHKHSILQGHDPTIVYAGNPQGRHPGETGQHGCVLVEAGADRRNELTFLETDGIRWIEREISIAGLETEQELLDVIEDTVRAEQEGGRNLVCRLRLTGRGPLHKSLREDRLVDLEQSLRDGLTLGRPFAWIDQMKDLTRPDIDVESRRLGQDFVGDLLRIVDDHRSDPALRDGLLAELNELFDHRVGRKYLAGLSDEQVQLVLDRAETLCLDLLVEDTD